MQYCSFISSLTPSSGAKNPLGEAKPAGQEAHTKQKMDFDLKGIKNADSGFKFVMPSENFSIYAKAA